MVVRSAVNRMVVGSSPTTPVVKGIILMEELSCWNSIEGAFSFVLYCVGVAIVIVVISETLKEWR